MEEVKRTNSKFPFEIQKEILRLYVEEGKNLEFLAKKYGTSTNPIKYILRTNKVPVRLKITFSTEDQQEMIRLYTNRILNVKEIGEKFGVSSTTAKRILLDNNVKIRNVSEDQRQKFKNNLEQIKKEFPDIEHRAHAAKYGIGPKSFRKFLRENGLHRPKLPTLNLEDVKDLYLNHNWSQERIAEKYGRACATTVSTFLIKNEIPTKTNKDYRNYTLISDFFENIDNHAKAYILGFIYADGYNNQKEGKVRIGIQERDRKTLEDINSYIQHDRENAIKIIPKEQLERLSCHNLQSIVYTVFHCQQISDDLGKLGCVQAKSLICDFPDLPDEFINSFIAGYFDGDGSVTVTYAKLKSGLISPTFQCAICVSEKFGHKLQIILEKQGIGSKFTGPRHNNKISGLRIAGNPRAIKFLDWIYSQTPIRMSRKYNKYVKGKQDLENYYAARDQK